MLRRGGCASSGVRGIVCIEGQNYYERKKLKDFRGNLVE